MKFPQKNSLDNWLEANTNPEIDKFLERNLAITEKVNTVLKERGIKKREFAKMLGKKPSEITKWLSGLHNLTLKSIVKIEMALGIDLINIEAVTEIKYVYLGSIKGSGLEETISYYEDSNYNLAM
jgi:transcriptional regulator with XRE-family HTH domain